MRTSSAHNRAAFSLIELVIVVIIIGVLAAIAVPRLSRGTEGAGDSALAANLAELRKAIDRYAAEHGGNYPDDDTIAQQLTQFTDDQGNISATRTGQHHLGPYLRKVPPLGVGPEKAVNGISDGDGDGVAWIYNEDTGQIRANTDDLQDDRGIEYRDY